MCNPSPCGPNTQCDNGICSCLADYYGDSNVGCRPECVLNSDCPRDRACVRNKCEDPCLGTCASDAICNVVNHVPMCSCPPGYEGNAFAFCRPAIGIIIFFHRFCLICLLARVFLISNDASTAELPSNPCSPSPCGPNSQCRSNNGQAICSCVPGYLGNPPNCRPECIVSPECSPNEICTNQRCRNPCIGTCGLGARCTVANRNPICHCSEGFTGDPFVRCLPLRKSSYARRKRI